MHEGKLGNTIAIDWIQPVMAEIAQYVDGGGPGLVIAVD